MKSIEFYTFEGDVWYRTSDGTTEQLTEQKRDVVRHLIEKVKEFYPQAMEALQEEYKMCLPNVPHFQFQITQRFCKCNFGVIDHSVSDIDLDGRMHFEHVPCPLRGECKREGIVCHPKFESRISKSEMRVLELIYKGMSKEKIADRLCLSVYTVKNHIRNAYTRIGVHDKAEFVSYAHRNNLFKDE